MIYLKLFYEFFKTGLFAIGGGMATIPFLQEMSDKYHWFSQAELVDMIAISESTPGAIGVNMASFAGYQTAGILGSLVATIGLVCPSIIIIIIISKFLKAFQNNKYVGDLFYGIRPCSTALVTVAALELIKITMINTDYLFDLKLDKAFNYKSIILGSILLFLIVKFKKHPAFYLAISAVIGIIFNFA